MGILLTWPVTAAIALKFKRKMEDVAMIGTTVMLVLMFLVGLVTNIQIGIVAVLVFSALCVMYSLFALFKDRKSFIETVFSPGGIVFAVLIIFFAASNLGRGIIGSDAPDYWGVLLKKYYYLNEIRVADTIHPRNMILWAVFAEKTWIGYADSMALWSMDVLMMTLVLPVLKFARGKYTVSKTVLITVFMMFMPLSMWGKVYGTFLADGIMCLAIGAMAVSIYSFFTTEDKVYLAQIFSELYLITGTKRIGILLASCMLAVFIFVYWKKENYAGNVIRNKVLVTCAIILCPIVTYLLWLGFSSYIILPLFMGIAGVFGARLFDNFDKLLAKVCIILIGLMAVIGSKICFDKILMGSGLAKTSTLNYFQEILSAGVIYWGDFIKISLVKLMILFVLLLLWVRVAGKGKILLKNEVLFFEGIALLVVNVVYLGALCVTYATSIAPANGSFGQYVPAIDRYVLCCFWSMIMLVAYWAMDNFEQSELKIGPIIISAVVVIMMTNLSSFSYYLIAKPEPVRFYGFEAAGITLTENDRIYLVAEAPIDVEYNVQSSFRYDMYPAQTVVKNEFNSSKADDGSRLISLEDFQTILLNGEIDYVYIQSIYDDFVTYYSDMIQGDLENVRSGSVFKVENDAEGVAKLVLVN